MSPYMLRVSTSRQRPAINVVSFTRSLSGTDGTLWPPMRTRVSQVPRVAANVGGFDRLMIAVARREIDMVAAWAVDRLGRSLTDLLSFLTDLHAKGVDLFLHQQGLETSTPSGRAMFQMLEVCSRSSNGP